MSEAGIPMLGNEKKYSHQKVHCGSMRVSTKDMAMTITYWIHTSMNKSKKSATNNTQWSYVMRNIIATDQHKVDLYESKSTCMMTILESIKCSSNPYHVLVT